MDELWLKLFKRAVDLIDSCAASGTREPKWTFGGGTVLFNQFRHRHSKDIDIFLTDAQYLSFFSPRLNPVSEAWLETGSGKYIEAAHYLKIEINDKECVGEIDFIVSPHLLEPYAQKATILGRKVMVETPEEILAKKIFYRADAFTARDVFDFSFLIEKGHTNFILEDSKVFGAKLDVIKGRIADFYPKMEDSFSKIDAVNYKPSFADAVHNIDRLIDALHRQHKPGIAGDMLQSIGCPERGEFTGKIFKVDGNKGEVHLSCGGNPSRVFPLQAFEQKPEVSEQVVRVVFKDYKAEVVSLDRGQGKIVGGR